MNCICGARIGTNRPRCYWCREYYELTSDLGRELIDADSDDFLRANKRTNEGTGHANY